MIINSFKKPVTNIFQADALSRLPLEHEQAGEEEEIVLIIELLDSPVIRAWCWPPSVDAVSRNYWLHCEEISAVKGCLMWGQHVIVPHMHRKQIYAALHANQRVNAFRMKALTR